MERCNFSTSPSCHMEQAMRWPKKLSRHLKTGVFLSALAGCRLTQHLQTLAGSTGMCPN
ncbi:Uncharacterized protein FKW44_019832 [Caligus rogercresseyi]|uniref:Uncharacterized protein n=1 Tax=Caligus rogercresseyi TaxID=217165 RepID=A0A7T8JYE8_CALRO|nr:Uncharacterized protein FKW44_019832 [Caligus rogercresseyi]